MMMNLKKHLIERIKTKKNKSIVKPQTKLQILELINNIKNKSDKSKRNGS